jgi:hypothetical protein
MPNILISAPATAADPGDLETEGLGAGDIEAVGRDEQHFVLWNAERRLDEGITGSVRLICTDAVDADHGLDPPVEPGIPNEFSDHSRVAVRQDGELMSRERGERLLGFRIGIEVEIILHQGSADSVIRLDPRRPQCKVERGTRHLPKVRIFLHQAAQPSVFQLLQPPDLRDHLAFARAQGLGLRQHGLNVVERAIGVENQGPNAHDKIPSRKRVFKSRRSCDDRLRQTRRPPGRRSFGRRADR